MYRIRILQAQLAARVVLRRVRLQVFPDVPLEVVAPHDGAAVVLGMGGGLGLQGGGPGPVSKPVPSGAGPAPDRRGQSWRSPAASPTAGRR